MDTSLQPVDKSRRPPHGRRAVQSSCENSRRGSDFCPLAVDAPPAKCQRLESSSSAEDVECSFTFGYDDNRVKTLSTRAFKECCLIRDVLQIVASRFVGVTEQHLNAGCITKLGDEDTEVDDLDVIMAGGQFRLHLASRGTSAFWTASLELETVSDQEMWLKCPDGVRFGGYENGHKQLFVRKAYSDLWRLISGRCRLDQQYPRCLVTGTPGIGKSVLLYFLAYRIRQNEPNAVVILQTDPETCFRVEGRRVEEGFTQSFKKDLREVKTWYLVDSCRPAENMSARTVMVSSPNHEISRRFLKDGAHRFWMPVWSEAEVRTAAAQPGRLLASDITLETALERFSQWAVQPDLYCLYESGKGREVSDMLVHMIVDTDGDYAYRNYYYRFASDYICQRVASTFASRSHKAVESLIKAAEGIPADKKIIIPALDVVNIRSSGDVQPEAYCKPVLMTAVDLSIVSSGARAGLFQMTTASQHPINVAGLQRLQTHATGMPFYFVVPPSLAERLLESKRGEHTDVHPGYPVPTGSGATDPVQTAEPVATNAAIKEEVPPRCA
ncbi:hypothetical protein HDU89_004734 [Geranomyces variabilis]|nr:hypothetical protein HDU89_004734 [Geranomyces variabilis]